jgi:hypothetical protein
MPSGYLAVTCSWRITRAPQEANEATEFDLRINSTKPGTAPLLTSCNQQHDLEYVATWAIGAEQGSRTSW